jgi:hypothetical protein
VVTTLNRGVFAIEAPDRVVVHAFDTRTHCIYDLDGHPSQLSVGALLETIALAATRYGLRAHIDRRADTPNDGPVFDVRLSEEPALAEDRLVPYIIERRVQRRPLHSRRLTEREKQDLASSVGEGFKWLWFERPRDRARVAWLNFASAKLRLTLPEAYRVHRDVIEWRAKSSERGIPDAALGASAPTLMLMRWAMVSWERIAFLNRYLAGTVMPRIELDLVPGLACAAHCVLVADSAPRGIDDYIAAGRALQRFWLTATRLGLQFQPQYTPLIFARYAREGVRFATRDGAMGEAQRVRDAVDRLLGHDAAPRAVFAGRIGAGTPAQSRSSRLPLELLMASSSDRKG